MLASFHFTDGFKNQAFYSNIATSKQVSGIYCMSKKQFTNLYTCT